jgi:hypothetical protein
MTDRRSFLLAGLAVFTVAAAMRTVPLYWSPLPHVLDGFAHAAHARATVATGHLPIGPGLRADLLVVTTFTAAASIVIGETPLSVIQPLLSLAGAAVPLVGMAVARRLAVDLGWPTRRVRAAALATGLLLAVQGLFLRHTSIPDPEPLGQLFAFLAVLSLHRLLNRPAEARRWAVPLAVLLVSFPILHKFSTFNAALGVTALAGAEIARRPSRRTAGLGVAVAAAFWTAFVAYYELVERFGVLGVAYVSQVRSNPGLFVGWVVVLLVAVAWYGATSTRTRRVLLYAPVGLMFGLVGVNAVRPVFPGTIRSEPAVVAGVALLAVPVAFAGYATDALEDRYETATLVTGLLAGPVVVALFALTAPLTPAFFATAIRAQAFLHVPMFVLVGLASARVAWRARGATARRSVRAGLLAVLATSTLLTVPLAFVALDTLTYPATTHESEFAAVEHAATHTPAGWATDHGPMRVGRTTFGADAGMAPARTWLRGGPPPACSMLSFDRWVTDGATFWPTSPQSVGRQRYEATLGERHLVYRSTGREAGALSRPTSTRSDGCEAGTVRLRRSAHAGSGDDAWVRPGVARRGPHRRAGRPDRSR